MGGDVFYLQLVGDVSKRSGRRRERRVRRGGEDHGAGKKEGGEEGNVVMRGTSHEEDSGDGDVKGEAEDKDKDEGAEADPTDAGSAAWTLEFRDLPDVPGKRPATSRLMYSVPIAQGNPRAFVEALGYA